MSLPERPREVIDADNMTAQQRREIWPELLGYLVDPCTAILFQSVEARISDPAVRAERYARTRASRALRDEIAQERPR